MEPLVRRTYRQQARQLVANIANLRRRQRTLSPATYAARMELREAHLRRHDAPPDGIEAADARVAEAERNRDNVAREHRNAMQREWRRDTANLKGHSPCKGKKKIEVR
ncbi:hypothetical protein ZHAS_00000996 [Anopheles sinensis]|uniref:Uncharacterized protein n=1 Tax=Anopheles sinensis TaxID=74873 RepID=A0A084VAW1_ANOSI|nr:hypothetical protein ZHAS_00000996 [Anopheles sinensis]